MYTALIVGATRGLGASLVKQYASSSSSAGAATQVYATTRSPDSSPPQGQGFPEDGSVKWLHGIDLMQSDVGDKLVAQLSSENNEQEKPLDAVYITAGRFMTESFTPSDGSGGGPNWDDEVTMYTTSAIAPVFVVQRLAMAGFLGKGSKVVLVSSEAGSIALRHESEGGGNYAHHASKSALNMAGRLLSLDLREKGVVVSMVHPGFMRTEMTKGVGFDKYWDAGGAVTPDEAAQHLVGWTEKLDMSKTGEFWAPRGPVDIGTAEAVLGKGLGTPLKLPW